MLKNIFLFSKNKNIFLVLIAYLSDIVIFDFLEKNSNLLHLSRDKETDKIIIFVDAFNFIYFFK